MKLILSARNFKSLEETGRHCSENGATCFVQPLDLTVKDQRDAAVDQVLEKYPSIDVLIHGAGISQRAPVRETKPDVIRKLMEVNFFGAVELTHKILPSMLRNKKGHIVVISSIVGKFGFPERSGYSASKHALHGFFETLRSEEYENNIKVTMVCPGSINTAISKRALMGEGNPYGKSEERLSKGMDVETCAEKIIKSVKKEKKEVFIGGKEILMVYLKRFFPGWFEKIVRKVSKQT